MSGNNREKRTVTVTDENVVEQTTSPLDGIPSEWLEKVADASKEELTAALYGKELTVNAMRTMSNTLLHTIEELDGELMEQQESLEHLAEIVQTTVLHLNEKLSVMEPSGSRARTKQIALQELVTAIENTHAYANYEAMEVEL